MRIPPKVHRDLKPSNIMLIKNGEVKVLDFGIARFVKAPSEGQETEKSPRTEPTSDGTIMGTPHYMSPEQARGEPVSAASDMYSFGLLLQELFTGQRRI